MLLDYLPNAALRQIRPFRSLLSAPRPLSLLFFKVSRGMGILT
jgi:hypothetical protein